jgi:predicted XRE-type DNA-binding protein
METKKPAAAEVKAASMEVKKPAISETKKSVPAAIRKPAPEDARKPVTESAADIKGHLNREKNSENKSKQKIEELIPQYIEKGMTKEEIAKALGMSSKEVSLIMDIKKMGATGGKA